ncbi:diadenosine 5',5'''-P1,P4-tetraphosphate asymmetrical hydrolase [Schizophyllum amplum]|uniref:Diadenosine 5',5'''-P1,P4-tetraphosphate asymmetrical hydrolase n=1 Tax=Schizophyllum amplum TaxID=97359 RepID=A0A550CS52_9AGAR|nr:diadenosine 5',5'''-P1,P4-tetraphosphate asymmetrical hydrolase [Auriculariopsis ampla]
MNRLLFSSIEVTRQVFYKTPQTFALVNLKPIVPGHVLVIPSRVVPRLADLDDAELSSLMKSVQRVGGVVERAYGADALTIACQDGKAAGQSIPHVHFHILPRKVTGDRFANNDDIYSELEKAEGALPAGLHSAVDRHEPLKVDADDDRKPRTIEEMEKEAQWLRTFFEEQ